MSIWRNFGTVLLVAICVLGGTQLAAAANYSEGVDGDLSDAVGAPTPWNLDLGANMLTATSGGGDFDLAVVTIGAGQQLDSIVLNSYSGSTQSFVGVQNSATWTAGLGGTVDPTQLLGWSHFGPASSATVGTDILDNIGVGGFGSTGFTPPLASGTYTFEFQDTGGAVNHSMTFNVSAVPEPSSLGLGIAALVLAAGWWCRRRRGVGRG